jgi:hypothetical protein
MAMAGIGDIAKDDSGYVYLFKCGDSWYKIGSSKQPDKRLSQVQTGNPMRVSLIHQVFTSDCAKLEKSFHNYYSQYRVEGEWFECSTDIEIEFLSLASVLDSQHTVLQKNLEMCLLEALNVTLLINDKDCSQMMPYQLLSKLEKRLSSNLCKSFKDISQKFVDEVSAACESEWRNTDISEHLLKDIEYHRSLNYSDEILVRLNIEDEAMFNNTSRRKKLQFRAINQYLIEDTFFTIPGIEASNKILEEVLDLLFVCKSMTHIKNKIIKVFVMKSFATSNVTGAKVDSSSIGSSLFYAIMKNDWSALIKKHSNPDAASMFKYDAIQRIEDVRTRFLSINNLHSNSIDYSQSVAAKLEKYKIILDKLFLAAIPGFSTKDVVFVRYIISCAVEEKHKILEDLRRLFRCDIERYCRCCFMDLSQIDCNLVRYRLKTLAESTDKQLWDFFLHGISVYLAHLRYSMDHYESAMFVTLCYELREQLPRMLPEVILREMIGISFYLHTYDSCIAASNNSDKKSITNWHSLLRKYVHQVMFCEDPITLMHGLLTPEQ